MQRSAGASFFLVVVLCLLALLAACGGGSSTGGAPATITVTPSPAQVELGGTLQLTVTVKNSSDVSLNNVTVIFATDNADLAQVSNGGLICGGKWDNLATPVVCNPSSAGSGGMATITITATNNRGSATGTLTVFVHPHVDAVVVEPAAPDCLSQGGVQLFSAKAFSHGTDITSTAGPATWTLDASAVGSLSTADLPINQVNVTASAPGKSALYARMGGTTSTPATFTTCPVDKIEVTVSGASDTSFTLDPTGTRTLAATVTDTKGATLTSPPLTWNSSAPANVSVSGSGVVTGNSAGAATVTASCSPRTCNFGFYQVFSNPVLATVTGTTTTTVYAAGAESTSLVPIDTSTNTAGTAITLGDKPNSFVMTRDGSTGYLGSDSGFMTLTTSSNTVSSPNSSFKGKVLAVSPDGATLVIADATTVRLVTVSSGSSQLFLIPSATRADFSPDSQKIYIAGANKLWEFTTSGGLKSYTLSSAVNDVAFTTQGSFGFLAGGSPAPGVVPRATCDDSEAPALNTVAAPALIAPLNNGGGMVAAEGSLLDIVQATTDGSPGCVPALSTTLETESIATAGFIPDHIIVTADSSKVFVTGSSGTLAGWDLTNSQPLAIPLGGGATASYSGGATPDGKFLYIGGSDTTVHRIDLTSNTDAQQISVGFKPDLVVVQPK